MKITKEDYEHLEALIQEELKILPLEQGQVGGGAWSETRLIWDYYWRAFHTALGRQQTQHPADYEFFRTLSEYLADSHIETALRKIILGKKE
jgi:DNA-binding FadR family transcriptional regulator